MLFFFFLFCTRHVGRPPFASFEVGIRVVEFPLFFLERARKPIDLKARSLDLEQLSARIMMVN